MSDLTISPNGQLELPGHRQYFPQDKIIEKTIDRFISLAAGIVKVPFVFVTLQDTENYPFKPCPGLDLSQAEWEIFCGDTLASSDLIIVSDTLQDHRFAHNPLVTAAPYIRFYAGVPLRTKDGISSGTLWLLDRQPRNFDAGQKQQLTDLAALGMDLLESNLAAQVLQHQLETERQITIGQPTASEQRFQMLAENSTDAISRHNLDGTFLYVSPASNTVWGYDPAEVIGCTTQQFLHPSYLPDYQKALKAILTDRKPHLYTFQIRRKNGEYIWVESSILAIRDALTGEALELQCSTREVGRRKVMEEALKKSEEQYRTLARNIPNSTVYMFDHNLRYILAEGSILSREQVGYVKQDLEGKTIWEVLPEGTAAELAPIYRNALDGQKTVLERNYNNRSYIVHILPAKDEKGDIYAGLVLTQEITDQKQVEQQLRLALGKEKELVEMKNQLISTASHEFRTPLSAIISSTELLEHYSQRWSEEKKREILGRISASANRLTGLIEDILIYNRAEQGRLGLARARVNLPDFCRDLVNNFQLNTSAGKMLRLVEIGKRQDAFLDVKLLNYILTNLISNGLKYSKPGGKVILELEWQPGKIVFRVKDWGIGIPLKDQAGLFEPFQRASNVGSSSGTGFGLAIVKHSVLAHGGHIQFESVEGQGTTFTVRLPLTENSVEVNRPETAPDSGLAGGFGPENKSDEVVNTWWLLAQAIEASSSGFFILDYGQEDHPLIYVSKGFERITSFLGEEALGKNPRFLAGADQDQPGLVELNREVEAERECRVVLRNYRKDGHLVWIELQLSPIRNTAGKVIYYVGIQNDVSDRIKAEIALNQSEQKFKALVENSPDLIVRFDQKGRYLYVNPTLEKLSGGQLTAEFVIGRSLSESGSLTQLSPEFEENLNKVFRSKETTDFELSPNSPGFGTGIHQMRMVPEFSSDGKEVLSVLCIGRDITDFRRTNQALQESEKRLSEILERVTDAIFSLDVNWRFSYFNPQAEKLFKRSREELLGQNIWESYPDTVGTNIAKMYELARREMVALCFEEYYTRTDTWVQVQVYPSGDGLSVYCQDVTKSKKEEESMIKSLEEYRSLMEQAPDAIYICDLAEKFLMVNAACCRLSGYSREELLEMYVYDLVPRDLTENARPPGFVLQKNEIVSGLRIARRKDGDWRTLEVNLRLLEDNRLMGIARDISDQVN